jgi:hypothetical protein
LFQDPHLFQYSPFPPHRFGNTSGNLARSSSSLVVGSLAPGYTPNHLQHAAERQKRQNQAYAAHGGYTVTLETGVSYMKEGTMKPKQVGVCESIVNAYRLTDYNIPYSGCLGDG